MFLFAFRSRVNPKSKEANRLKDIAGAYVNCWINFKDYEASEKLAKMLIKEQGWLAEKKTDESKIQKKLLRNQKQKRYYAEAIKYGYTLVFHIWPKGAPDADEDEEEERK